MFALAIERIRISDFGKCLYLASSSVHGCCLGNKGIRHALGYTDLAMTALIRSFYNSSANTVHAIDISPIGFVRLPL